nr:MAG TPA: hypothetical protein [Caudoviricetes sp.]
MTECFLVNRYKTALSGSYAREQHRLSPMSSLSRTRLSGRKPPKSGNG